jgi:tRNA pseudouridine38-40 synthase
MEINYKLTISYDGTGYVGWQTQPGKPTIQGVIENLLFKVFGKQITLRYPSRTDAGVHAYGQVASFKCESEYSAERMQKILNTQLPPDISILDVKVCGPEFDARKALKKKYTYRISNAPIRSPFYINRVWWLKYKLNKNDMLKAFDLFIGEKDFKAFMGSGTEVKTTIRNIYAIDIKQDGHEMNISFTGNGFLKHMIRNIVGTVVEVGIGRYGVQDVVNMLESKDRRKAGITAPAYALYLEEIFYDERE